MSRSKSGEHGGLTVMLVAGRGAHTRRFQLTKRHAWFAAGAWALLMLTFAVLGFYVG